MIKFSLILSSSRRSLKYLKILIQKKYKPSHVIFFSKKKNKQIFSILKKQKINFKFVNTDQINDKNVSKEIIKNNNRCFIYSGYPGQIIKVKKILSKVILHAHPGSLYDFRGSTTMYYSLILKKKIYCSVLKLNTKIDRGKVLYKKKFNLPKKIAITNFEKEFDDKIRINTIIEYLKLYSNKKNRLLKKNYSSKSNQSPYFICHPLIRRIVINKKFY